MRFDKHQHDLASFLLSMKNRKVDSNKHLQLLEQTREDIKNKSPNEIDAGQVDCGYALRFFHSRYPDLVKNFLTRSKRTIKCTLCEKVIRVEEAEQLLYPVTGLDQALKNAKKKLKTAKTVQFSSLLDFTTNEEKVEIDCPACKRKVLSTITTTFVSQNVILEIQRCRSNSQVGKSEAKIAVPKLLHLPGWSDEHQLISSLHHTKSPAHWYLFCLSELADTNESWTRIDDHKVRKNLKCARMEHETVEIVHFRNPSK